MDINGNYIQSQFCSYEIALKLKELGFDEECFCTYHNAELSRNPSHKIDATPIQGKPYVWKNSKVHNSIVCVPLWQQVIDWFREVKNIIVEVWYDNTQDDGFSWLYEIYIDNNEHQHDGSYYDSFYEAREQAILKAIELCKKNYHKK